MSFTLTVFSIVIVMNAVNFIDGLDGLVAGVCLIANGVFFAYSYLLVRDTGAEHLLQPRVLHRRRADRRVHRLPAAELESRRSSSWATPARSCSASSWRRSAIAITGQLDPAIIGDNDEFGRSQLLGAFIPILLPVVVVLLPLLDFGLAVIRRMRAGKSPFSPDRKHLHHRMLDMGHSDRDAVLIFYAWTAIVGLVVLLMYIGTQSEWPGDYLIGVAFGLVGVAACLVVTFLPSRRAVAAASPIEPAHQETVA